MGQIKKTKSRIARGMKSSSVLFIIVKNMSRKSVSKI